MGIDPACGGKHCFFGKDSFRLKRSKPGRFCADEHGLPEKRHKSSGAFAKKRIIHIKMSTAVVFINKTRLWRKIKFVNKRAVSVGSKGACGKIKKDFFCFCHNRLKRVLTASGTFRGGTAAKQASARNRARNSGFVLICYIEIKNSAAFPLFNFHADFFEHGSVLAVPKKSAKPRRRRQTFIKKRLAKSAFKQGNPFAKNKIRKSAALFRAGEV